MNRFLLFFYFWSVSGDEKERNCQALLFFGATGPTPTTGLRQMFRFIARSRIHSRATSCHIILTQQQQQTWYASHQIL